MNKPFKLPWPTFPESFVIDELLKSSQAFQDFYEAERNRIIQPIYWAKDASLPEGIDYRFSKFLTGESVIRLRRVPALVQDACKVAHELEHVVIDIEGFPILRPATPEKENLSSAISSMIEDLLVNSRLQKYGFDLQNDYETEIEESKRQLSRFTTSPTNRLDRIHWMVIYVGYLLDWELLSVGKSSNEFKEWFDTRYPDIAGRGKKLLEMVKRIGYDNPEKQSKLYREIIRRYDLAGFVFLHQR
jgi:hypothetical protein